MPRTQIGTGTGETCGELLVERALPARERLGSHTIGLGESVDQPLFVELVGRQRQREPVAMAERACSLVPEPRELADVRGYLRADRLRRLPGLQALGGVVAPAEDALDLGVSDLDAAHDPAMAREAQIDRGLELHNARAQVVGYLVPEHEVAQKIELAARLAVRSRLACRLERAKELAVGERIRPRDLRTGATVRVLLGRGDLRIPPREVRREQERGELRLRRVEDRERVAHHAAATMSRSATSTRPLIGARSYPRSRATRG